MPADFDHPGSGTPSPLPGGFRAAVTRELTALGLTVTAWEAEGVHCVDAEGAVRYVGLANLYRRVKAVGNTERDAEVRQFLTEVVAAVDRAVPPEDLSAVADQLMPRVGRPFAGDLPAPPWSAPLGDTGLTVSLVIDHPRTMMYVTAELVEKSGRTGDEWLATAVENLKRATPGDLLTRPAEEVEVYIATSGDGYDASRALVLDTLLPSPELGHFVAVPSRDELAVMPVNPDTLTQVHVLKMLARDNYAKHPYPISDEVYWVWQGGWYLFPITMTADSIKVTAPKEFIVVISRLEVEGGEATGGPPPAE